MGLTGGACNVPTWFLLSQMRLQEYAFIRRGEGIQVKLLQRPKKLSKSLCETD